MNRCTILNLCAVTTLSLALLPNSAASQQRSLKEQLVGSWTIVSNDNVTPDGTKRQIFGPNPNGIMILDADGRYALIVVNPARPKFKGNTRLDGTPEETKAAIAGTVASFGRSTKRPTPSSHAPRAVCSQMMRVGNSGALSRWQATSLSRSI